MSANKDWCLMEAMACHECDLLVSYPKLIAGSEVICPRCDHMMTKSPQNAANRMLAFAFSGLIFLLMSGFYPFLSFSASGQGRVVTLLQSLDVLVDEKQIILALMIMLVILVIPALFLMGVLYVIGSLKLQGSLPPYGSQILGFILALAPWSMVEIFLIGTLVSLVKISSLATVTLGMSFWAYILFTMLMISVLLHLDKVQIWQWVEDSVS